MERRSAAVLIVSIPLAFCGCCIVPPPAAPYFDRLEPFSAATAFAYAVETGEWEFAREVLVPAERARYAAAELPAVVGKVGEKRADGAPSLRDLLMEARLIRPLGKRLPGVTITQVPFIHGLPMPGKARPSDRVLVGAIHLVVETDAEAKARTGDEDEPPLWHVDLEKTLAEARALVPWKLEDLLADPNYRIAGAAREALGLPVTPPASSGPPSGS